MADQVPTQSQHPWRATVRTIVAAMLALAVILPVVATELGISQLSWVAVALAVAGGVTRVLALPAVNEWLKEYVPWLSATPRTYDD